MKKNSIIHWTDPRDGGKKNIPIAGEAYYAITQPIIGRGGELCSWSFKSVIIESKRNEDGEFESSCNTSFLFENAPIISNIINEGVKIFEGPKLVGHLKFIVSLDSD